MVKACSHVLFLHFILLISMGFASGQEKIDPNDPEVNFEYLWNALDRNYAQFGVKKVDWDALYRVYRPQVTPETTDSQLYDIMMSMMRHLNDSHVGLTVGERRTCAGVVDELTREGFSLQLVTSKYLRDKASTALGGSFTHGWLTREIGYLHIGDFKDGIGDVTKAIDAFMRKYATAEGIIVDVRYNPGGTGRSANIVADRFADCKRHYMTTQTRYGKGHDDFAPTQYWNVEPRGPIQFTRPTILLTHRFSESAADNFAIAMRVLPHVTVVGDFTAGAFSSQYPDTLPNGWTLWVAFMVIRDHNGVCWDGIGGPPDLRIKNTKADIDAEKDRVLEFAVQLLEKGDLKPQDEASSLKNLKTSLVDEFAKGVEEEGLETALARLNKARVARDEKYLLALDEIMVLVQEYMRDDKFQEAIAILKVCRAFVLPAGDLQIHDPFWSIIRDQPVNPLGPLLAAPSEGGAEFHDDDAALRLSSVTVPPFASQIRKSGAFLPTMLPSSPRFVAS